MIAIFVFAVLLPAGIIGTAVDKCNNDNSPIGVRISGCEIPPCNLVRGKDVILEVDFVAPQDTETLTPKVLATTLGITITYELPKEQQNACNHLLNGAYCPIYGGEDVTYKLTMPVERSYPKVSLLLEFSVLDDTKKNIFCFRVPCKVVDG